MSDDLTIVGASVRAAAYSALRAGFRPYAIDQFADRDLADVCHAVRIRRYPRDLLSALRDAPQAPWIYTGGLENYPRLVDRLAEIQPLWGNPGRVLHSVRDPWVLAEIAAEAGLKMPTTLRDWLGIGSGGASEIWLKKPRRSSGGHQVAVATAGVESPSRNSYYQRHMPGPTYGAVFLATTDRGCQLLGVSRQIRGNNLDFRYQGSLVAPAPGPWHPSELTLMRFGQLLAERLGIRGLFNVDFITNDDGNWILEVNPRYSASVEVLERASGVSFLDRHASAFDASRTSQGIGLPTKPPTRAIGKTIVYARNASVVTPELNRLRAEWHGPAAWPGIADLPRTGDTIGAGQPVCTVFAEGESVAEVERQLQARSERVLQSLAAAEGSE